jgi:hypothetical protein
MISLSESSDSTNRCIALLSKHGGCDQVCPEKNPKCCAEESIKAITKTWISLAGASSLAFIVCMIHWLELKGIDNTALSRCLIICSSVATLIGIGIILLAVPFEQIIGYALLMSIFVNSLSGLAIAWSLSNEHQKASESITSLSNSLEKIKATAPLVREGGGPSVGDASAPVAGGDGVGEGGATDAALEAGGGVPVGTGSTSTVPVAVAAAAGLPRPQLPRTAAISGAAAAVATTATNSPPAAFNYSSDSTGSSSWGPQKEEWVRGV